MNRPEFDELALTPVLRVCTVCKAPTYWRKRNQKTLGMCPDHSRYRDDDRPRSVLLRMVLGEFPASVIIDHSTRAYPPGSWAEPITLTVRGRFGFSGIPFRITALGLHPDAGPCVGCGGLIKRYGSGARLHCTDCAPIGRD